MKKLFLLLLIVAVANCTVFSQSEATTKGAALISGMFSFTSQGGDLYESGDDRANTIMVSPSYLYFVDDKLAVGGALSFNRVSQGDFDFTTFGIGPKAAYFFDSGAPAIPYIGAGFSYLSVGSDGENEGGFGYNIGGGAIIRKGQLGFSFEGGLMAESYKPDGADDRIKGNTIYVAVGIVGFLY